jgi:hypothetical protein
VHNALPDWLPDKALLERHGLKETRLAAVDAFDFAAQLVGTECLGDRIVHTGSTLDGMPMCPQRGFATAECGRDRANILSEIEGVTVSMGTDIQVLLLTLCRRQVLARILENDTELSPARPN